MKVSLSAKVDVRLSTTSEFWWPVIQKHWKFYAKVVFHLCLGYFRSKKLSALIYTRITNISNCLQRHICKKLLSVKLISFLIHLQDQDFNFARDKSVLASCKNYENIDFMEAFTWIHMWIHICIYAETVFHQS